MKMFAFSKVSNFGDQLNHWLWPKLLPGGFFTENDERLFLGIGSVLCDSHPANAEKVVFGAGYAGYSALPALDETWKLYFVRGKNTAAALNLPEDMAVGDSGILIRAVTLPQYEKRFRVSFMPHYESAMFGSWEKICNKLGINFIDPRWDVDVVLEHMLSSELLVSEAMHAVDDQQTPIRLRATAVGPRHGFGHRRNRSFHSRRRMHPGHTDCPSLRRDRALQPRDHLGRTRLRAVVVQRHIPDATPRSLGRKANRLVL